MTASTQKPAAAGSPGRNSAAPGSNSAAGSNSVATCSTDRPWFGTADVLALFPTMSELATGRGAAGILPAARGRGAAAALAAPGRVAVPAPGAS